MIINSSTYNDILKICKESETFYYTDVYKNNKIFRLFNYRLANYNDWLLSPLTFELRGLMIEINNEEEFIRVASRPPAKFFNLYENPFVTDLNLDCIGLVSDKLDGSLISTFLIDKQLGLKSKMSLTSDQALDAINWLNTQPILYNEFLRLANLEYTIYCEFCSPNNRIVIGYTNPCLTVLGVRNNITGVEYDSTISPILSEFWVSTQQISNIKTFIPSIRDQIGIEGYVITLLTGPHTGTRFKCKSDWYLSLHHCKDSVNNPRRLWEVIVNEGIDDVRSLFHDDALLIKQIDEMQQKVDHVYNSMINLVESFYNDNKHLERKDFAIKGQTDVPKLNFSLCMNLYLGKQNDYKQFLVKHYKSFGIKDENIEE